MRFVDMWWQVTPTFRPQLFPPNGLELVGRLAADLGAPLLLGGIWLMLWAKQVKDRPLLPLRDPRLALDGHAVPGSAHEVATHA
jgi:hypothetical protein